VFPRRKKKVARNKQERYRPVSSFYFFSKAGLGQVTGWGKQSRLMGHHATAASGPQNSRASEGPSACASEGPIFSLGSVDRTQAFSFQIWFLIWSWKFLASLFDTRCKFWFPIWHYRWYRYIVPLVFYQVNQNTPELVTGCAKKKLRSDSQTRVSPIELHERHDQ
jgi:hypothetical protein